MSEVNFDDFVKQHDAKFVDLRFTDTRGKEQHVTVPVGAIDDDFFKEGKMFDGSSIAGWKAINESDMVLMPVNGDFLIDPFYDDVTVIVRCDVLEPTTMQGYTRCPRATAHRAEAYLQSTGIADTAFFGPEAEFYVFDGITFENTSHKAGFQIFSRESIVSSNLPMDGTNTGHHVNVKGGYFPVPPQDSSQDLRSAICTTLMDLGQEIEVHHHEVGQEQQELGTKFNTLIKKADELQVYKYVVMNVAQVYGKTATFMPKPLTNDNGTGMHVHQSLMKDGKNLFTGDGYGGLSELALHYIGGIIKHARALNAFTNPSTNSYKRLVPGFEAPVLLAYSARNRSASIRIPYVANPKGRRMEVRFPDAMANPYFAFSAMLMAGLDGIQNKIDPGDAMDKDLYDLPAEELADVPTVASSLEQALEALDKDREFLLQGDVFSNDLIDAYIALKQEEVDCLNTSTHPVEFEMYYSS